MSDTSPDLTPEQGSPEPAVKKRTVRRTKSSAETPAESLADGHSAASAQEPSPAPRKRTVRKKEPETENKNEGEAPEKKTPVRRRAVKTVEEAPAEEASAKPRRGRPRKKPVEEVSDQAETPVPAADTAVKPVRRRSKKAVPMVEHEAGAPDSSAPVLAPQHSATSAESSSGEAEEKKPKVIRQRFVRKNRAQDAEGNPDAAPPAIRVVQEGAADLSDESSREPQRGNDQQRQRFDRNNQRNNDRFNKNRTNRPDNRNGNYNNKNGNGRFKNRRNGNFQDNPSPQNNAPVSYTHLTLPTIYTV